MDAISQTSESGHAEMMANYNRLRDLLRGKSERKVAGNTVISRVDFGHTIAITFWKTVILEAHDDGSLTLNSGGYKTVTTQNRLQDFLPPHWTVITEGGTWTLVHFLTEQGFGGDHVGYAFKDGMVIDGNGDVRGQGTTDERGDLVKLGKRINKYAAAYATDFVAGNILAPSADNGDCTYCSKLQTGPGVGVAHLRRHVEEHYFVPSLLVNAMSYKGSLLSKAAAEFVHNVWYGSQEDQAWALSRGYLRLVTERQIAAVLKAYLRKELGLTS